MCKISTYGTSQRKHTLPVMQLTVILRTSQYMHVPPHEQQVLSTPRQVTQNLAGSYRILLLLRRVASCCIVTILHDLSETGSYRILFLLHGGKEFWRHPGQSAAHVPAHKGGRLLLGQPQVGNLDDWPVEIPQVTQQVVTLQVEMDDPAGVQVLHACTTNTTLINTP